MFTAKVWQTEVHPLKSCECNCRCSFSQIWKCEGIAATSWCGEPACALGESHQRRHLQSVCAFFSGNEFGSSIKLAWQQTVWKRKDVPPIDDQLEFIDSRAQASESIVPHSSDQEHPAMKKKPKVWTSYQLTTEQKYAGCYKAAHPLYTCSQFKALPHSI